MNLQSIIKGGLIALAVATLQIGFELSKVNVWAGMIIILFAVLLPFVREFLKKFD